MIAKQLSAWTMEDDYIGSSKLVQNHLGLCTFFFLLPWMEQDLSVVKVKVVKRGERNDCPFYMSWLSSDRELYEPPWG